MNQATELPPVTWERMFRAVEKVRERLLRSSGTLEQAGIPYAVVGDCAVAASIERIDESAVRYTSNVELLIEESDFDNTKHALLQSGLSHFYSLNTHRFLDNQNAKQREFHQNIFCSWLNRRFWTKVAPTIFDRNNKINVEPVQPFGSVPIGFHAVVFQSDQQQGQLPRHD